jgi:hypothetical protein
MDMATSILLLLLLVAHNLSNAQVQESARLFSQALVDVANNGLGFQAYQVWY